jgi:hypothetical protein
MPVVINGLQSLNDVYLVENSGSYSKEYGEWLSFGMLQCIVW